MIFLAMVILWLAVEVGAWAVWLAANITVIPWRFLSGAEYTQFPEWPDIMLDACERVEARIKSFLILPPNREINGGIPSVASEVLQPYNQP